MATYSKSILLRVTEAQRQRIVEDAAKAGQNIQNYVRGRLLPDDPTAVSSTPDRNAVASTAGEVTKTRNSIGEFYADLKAGLLTDQPIDVLLENAINKGQAALTGEEPQWQQPQSPVVAKRSRRSLR